MENIEQLENLEKYYVDFYNNLGSLLQKQDNFILGRRGTGKTTLLYRGYYECLKTISPKINADSDFFSNKKVLPIFIDLTTCNDLFVSDKDVNLMNMHFIRHIIHSLKKQFEIMFDERVLGVFRKENPTLDDLDYIEKVLVEGISSIRDRRIDVERKVESKQGASMSTKLNSINASLKSKISANYGSEELYKYSEIKIINVQDFLDKLNDIRKKAGIDSIYIFLDEFSDLNDESQISLSNLLKNFLGSKIDLYFKIGAITDRYNFGDKIIIGRDIFMISLDLNEHVEIFGGIVPATKQLEKFLDVLLTKRLDTFCSNLNYNHIFKIKKEDLLYRVTRESLGVPRTIGLILQKAWIQCSASGHIDNKIGLNEVNYGIRNARKNYFKQFQGSVKSGLIPGYHMDMWNTILERAIKEKSRRKDRPASHFMIDPIRSEYLKKLCENFLIHFLEDSRTSKYGGKYSLYSIDYDVCLENKIKYAESKDQFTSARFIYDDVLINYDPYFIKERIKSYQCPQCGTIYEEKEVAKAKVKRCFEDDCILVEIIHKEAPTTQGNYTEVESKILGMITSLESEDEAMSAQEIADAVGCSRQKVSSWSSRVLAKKGIINIVKVDNKNYYYSNDCLIDL
ncbi:hypothetical protein FXW07_17790 [Methanosarcina sp. DH1]|uniref:ORC-CDC6 family AAA ATPase n=1 Tax=Methanosarcina sp. DH1 TaxID=2605695 RepID=UPI001E421FAE|nr:hypothetical protein [Methanosarcina sp. DH1]MCC4768399.1 hypothetical protein [Methanosarcina sp. DH1]